MHSSHPWPYKIALSVLNNSKSMRLYLNPQLSCHFHGLICKSLVIKYYVSNLCSNQGQSTYHERTCFHLSSFFPFGFEK